MRIKVTKEQFQLLLSNYYTISDRGLAVVLNGSTLNKITENNKNNNGKYYKVKIWFGGMPSEIIVSSGNSASALVIAKRMFPNARVISAGNL